MHVLDSAMLDPINYFMYGVLVILGVIIQMLEGPGGGVVAGS